MCFDHDKTAIEGSPITFWVIECEGAFEKGCFSLWQNAEGWAGESSMAFQPSMFLSALVACKQCLPVLSVAKWFMFPRCDPVLFFYSLFQIWWPSGGKASFYPPLIHPGSVPPQPSGWGLHWLLLHLPLHPLHNVYQAGEYIAVSCMCGAGNAHAVQSLHNYTRALRQE